MPSPQERSPMSLRAGGIRSRRLASSHAGLFSAYLRIPCPQPIRGYAAHGACEQRPVAQRSSPHADLLPAPRRNEDAAAGDQHATNGVQPAAEVNILHEADSRKAAEALE